MEKVKKFFCIEIPGRPVPAVRMTRRGKHIKLNAQKYIAYKNEVAWRARSWLAKQQDFKEPLKGKISVYITVYICGSREGDWDNYAKTICDGLNGVCWIDDRQIAMGIVKKVRVKTAGEQKAVVRFKEIL